MIQTRAEFRAQNPPLRDALDTSKRGRVLSGPASTQATRARSLKPWLT
jgi:hypothetical protein